MSQLTPGVATQLSSSDTHSSVKSEPPSDSDSESEHASTHTSCPESEPGIEPPAPEFVECPGLNSLEFTDDCFDDEWENTALDPLDPLADAKLCLATADPESELPVFEEGDCVSGLAIAVMQNEISNGESFSHTRRAGNEDGDVAEDTATSSSPLVPTVCPANLSTRPLPPEVRYRAVQVLNPVESFHTVRDSVTPGDVIVFRCSLGSEDDCKAWIREFEASTNTKWIVQYTTTAVTSLDFKKVLKCHLASHGKTKSSFSKRNLQCPARVIMKIKKLTESNILNDVYFQRPAPLRGEVVIEDVHNHSIATGLRLLRPLPDVRMLFVGYFKDGMSCSTACQSHTAALIAAGYPEDVLADTGMNPSYKTVSRWYKAWEVEALGS